MRKTREVVLARGHDLILSNHKTTLEITKEEHLTIRGDCIIAVGSDKGAADLAETFKKAARNSCARIIIRIELGDDLEEIQAFGDPHLVFTHPTDIVIRKSDYICGRTVAIRANKAAAEISKSIVKKLRDPRQKVRITFTVNRIKE